MMLAFKFVNVVCVKILNKATVAAECVGSLQSATYPQSNVFQWVVSCWLA